MDVTADAAAAVDRKDLEYFVRNGLHINRAPSLALVVAVFYHYLDVVAAERNKHIPVGHCLSRLWRASGYGRDRAGDGPNRTSSGA